ncbi:hypothetical protein DFJ73DRAFT_871501 [Zopfochytrium polystomum]|nr:hypothetical protein DFJ73DRAFT_871501 [Zopfochytrium polystomum]
MNTLAAMLLAALIPFVLAHRRDLFDLAWTVSAERSADGRRQSGKDAWTLVLGALVPHVDETVRSPMFEALAALEKERSFNSGVLRFLAGLDGEGAHCVQERWWGTRASVYDTSSKLPTTTGSSTHEVQRTAITANHRKCCDQIRET